MITHLVAIGLHASLLVGTPPAARAPIGTYDAWIETQGGRATFTLDVRAVEHDGSDGAELEDVAAFVVNIINGEEIIAVPNASIWGESLLLRFDPYEADMILNVSDEPGELHGTWLRKKDRDEIESLPCGAGPVAPLPMKLPLRHSLPERWSIEFEPAKRDASSTEQATITGDAPTPPPITSPDVGLFRIMPDGRARGTILTTTGDSRYLHGTFDGTTLELSSFSGSGVSLLRATYTPDSGGAPATLVGERWSGPTSHRRFAAVADPDAALPDDMSITRAIADPDLDALRFTDERGNEVALSSLVEGPAIVQLFGTWCPNSNDAAKLMRELWETYPARGVDVVALAFEETGDFAVDSPRVAIFRARHGVRYPILLAGTSDKKEAAKRLPFLDRVHSFPSLIFIDAEGRVRAIHTGYAGPATWEEHDAMRARILAAADSIVAD